MPNETVETVETTETVTVEQPQQPEAQAAPEGETPEAKAERLKAELDGAQARIHELNKENEKRRLAEKAAAEKKLQDDGKLQELADERAKERDAVIAERDAAAARLTKANEILAANVEATIADWPDEVKNLIPNGETDALTRFEKMNELTPLAKRLMDEPARPGNGPGPRASGGPDGVDAKAAKEAVARQVRSAF